ncbi:cytochrome P450 [Xylariaceae sp. FL0016]|nr:cytochrome P450 [Xylariaceae sp. FL0016]
MSLPDMFPLLMTLAICYIVSVIVYRLFFHPLAKIPGPFWARLSGYPAFWYALKKERHVWLWDLQEKYGPTFRIAPNSVLVNTPSGFESIYGRDANVKKAAYYKASRCTLDALTTWNSTDKAIHARKRRGMNSTFSDKALRSAETFIHSNTDRWCDLLAQQAGPDEWSKSVNMARWADYLVFDILGDLCFGRSFNMKEPNSDLRHIPELMISFLTVVHPLCLSPFVTTWNWLKPGGLDRVLAAFTPPALKRWEVLVTSLISDRVRVEKESEKGGVPDSQVRRDFFHYLYQAKDPETGKPGYSQDELWAEIGSLIIAGADTTAITTAAFVFYLARNLDVQDRLAKEIRSKFATFDEIRGGPALASCQFLRATIKETLRMSPSVPSDLSREVLNGGLVIDGHFIPQGFTVGSAAYCMHLNKDIYPQPFEFNPERWIVDASDPTSADRVALAESAYIPFSRGPRGCIGKNLAYPETSIVFAKLVYHFEIRQDPASGNLGGGKLDAIRGRRVADQYQLYDIFVSMRDGPIVKLRKRAS